jgi:hypothetical protein
LGNTEVYLKQLAFLQKQIEAMAEHLSQIPKGVSPAPIFNQIKRLEAVKTQAQREYDELISNSQNLQMPASLMSYENFLKSIQRLVTMNGDSNNLKAKIIKKLIYKIDVRPEGFNLHYYVGANQVSFKKWEIENHMNLKATASDSPQSLAKAPKNGNDNFFKIFSSS